MADLQTSQSRLHGLQSPSDDGRLATPAEVAEFFRTTTGKLANDRVLGRGPKFVKFNRRILYRWSDVHEFVAQQTLQRTDDLPGSATPHKKLPQRAVTRSTGGSEDPSLR